MTTNRPTLADIESMNADRFNRHAAANLRRESISEAEQKREAIEYRAALIAALGMEPEGKTAATRYCASCGEMLRWLRELAAKAVAP